MKKNNKIYSELPYKERLKLEFKEKSMVYRFYLWLSKKKKKKKNEREKRLL